MLKVKVKVKVGCVVIIGSVCLCAALIGSNLAWVVADGAINLKLTTALFKLVYRIISA